MLGTKVKGKPIQQIDKVRNIKISPFIILLIFYCLLDSAHTTVSFDLGFRADIIVAFICYFYFNRRKAIKVTSSTFLASAILIVGALFYQHGGKYYVYIGIILQVSLAVVLINLKDQWRMELFDKISIWFSILLAISLFVWFIHLFYPLPHTTILLEETATSVSRPIYNYFFFQEFDPNVGGLGFARFQSFFLEPGHLGTIVALFLFADQFNFVKKRNLVFLVAVIVSFSASAYILVGVGYLLNRLSSKNFFKSVLGILLLGAFIWFFAGFNGGDNVVSNLIFGKLTREEGAIEGRVTLEVVQVFYNMLSSGEDLLFGKSVFGKDDLAGSGIILFFVQQGIVGIILLFLVYYSIYKSCKSSYGFLFFLLYIISFLQRTYPYWDFFIITFILGLSYVKYEQRNDISLRRHKKVQQ